MTVEVSTVNAGKSLVVEGPTLEGISRDECLRLLGSQVIGRVAVADFNAAPLVVPVNFVLDGETVIFRCDYGTKFRRAVLREQPVSFQVDSFDTLRRSGWSVLIEGLCEEVGRSFDSVDHVPWAGGEKAHRVRILPGSISGRRIVLPPVEDLDDAGYL